MATFSNTAFSTLGFSTSAFDLDEDEVVEVVDNASSRRTITVQGNREIITNDNRTINV